MINEEKDKTCPITQSPLSKALSLAVFCITGNSPISISSTWHIFSGFPVPMGLCYHDQVRRKLQNWHPVIFHAGIKCWFTMKSLVLVYKIQCTSEVNFSYWMQFLDWQIRHTWAEVDLILFWRKLHVHGSQLWEIQAPPATQGLSFPPRSDRCCQDSASQSLYCCGSGPSNV